MVKSEIFPWEGDGTRQFANCANKVPKPPKGLPLAGKKLWREIQAEYGIADSTGLAYLSAGCFHYCRMKQAQAILKKEGLTVRGRYGQPLPHPAAKIENDSSASMLRCFKALNLDLQPLADGPGRPGGK